MESGPGLSSVDPIWVLAGPADHYRSYQWPGIEPGRGVSLPAQGYRFQDLLGWLPGLSLQESFGGIDAPRIAARGSGTQSAPVSRGLDWTLNGFPLGFTDGSFLTPVIDPGWAEEARHQTAAEAGGAQLGGRIALTANGLARSRCSLEIRLSDRQAYSGRVALSADVGGGPLLLGVSALDDAGWRGLAEQSRESLLLHWRRPLGDGRDWEVQVYGARPRFMVPGPLNLDQIRTDPRQNIPPVRRDRPRRDTDFLQWGNRLTLQPTAGISLSAGLTGILIRDEFRQLLPNGIQRARGGDIHLDIRMRHESDADAEAVTLFDLRASAGRRDVLRFRQNSGERGLLVGDNRYRPWNIQGRLAHQQRLSDTQRVGGALTLLGGSRRIDENPPGNWPGPGTALRQRDFHWAPSLNWEWTPLPDQRLQLTASRSYEGPALEDLLFMGGPMASRHLESRMLDWQRADTLEARWTGKAGRLFWDFTVYTADWRGEFLSLADGAGSRLGVVNADRTRHQGVELVSEWMLHSRDGLQIVGQGKFIQQRVRFANDAVYGDNRLGGVPPQEGRVSLRMSGNRGWSVEPIITWQRGPLYADHANTLAAGGASFYAIRAGRDLGSTWRAELEIHNLFDRAAVASTAGVLDLARMGGSDFIYLPALGRRMEFTLSATW